MSRRTKAYESHQVHKTVEALTAQLEAVRELAEKDSNALDEFQSLWDVNCRVRASLAGADGRFVPPGVLNSLDQFCSGQLKEVSSFHGDSNAQHLQSADSLADNVLAILPALGVPTPSQDLEALREAAASYRRSVGQLGRHLQEQFAGVSKQATAVETQLQASLVDIQSQKSRLDAAIAEYQKQFSTAENTRRTDFAKAEAERAAQSAQQLTEVQTLRTRLDSAIAQLEQRIAAAEDQRRAELAQGERDRLEQVRSQEEKRATRFEALLDEKRKELDTLRKEKDAAFADFLKSSDLDRVTAETSLKARGETVLSGIESLKVEAQELVHVIGNTGMTGGYQRVATSERWTARFWQFVALVGLVGLIVFAVGAFRSVAMSGFNWGLFGSRAFAAFAFGVLVAYGARQADRHEEVERRSKRIELELASIDPYLQPLPVETRNVIKQQLADRMFGRADHEAQVRSPEVSGTSADIVKMLGDIVTRLVVELGRKK